MPRASLSERLAASRAARRVLRVLCSPEPHGGMTLPHLERRKQKPRSCGQLAQDRTATEQQAGGERMKPGQHSRDCAWDHLSPGSTPAKARWLWPASTPGTRPQRDVTAVAGRAAPPGSIAGYGDKEGRRFGWRKTSKGMTSVEFDGKSK